MSAIRLHPEITPPRLDCLARTERFELLNPETRGKRWGDWRLFFIAERVDFCGKGSVTVAVPRSGPVGPIRDPAPLARVPLRGFGGDGAGCRRNRKGPSNVAQQNPHKDKYCTRKKPHEKACKS